MSETEIIARASQGEEEAQRALYESYYAAAFRLCYLLLQNSHDAEEVVQDAFVYLFRNLRRYDADRGSFWAWLRVTLVSRCRNKRRRQQPTLVSLESLEAGGRLLPDPHQAGDPARALEMRGARQVIWDALQQVSPAAQEAVILRFYEGMPYAEIAQALDCSPEAARARVAHAKVQLKRLLAGQLETSAQQRAVPETAGAKP